MINCIMLHDFLGEAKKERICLKMRKDKGTACKVKVRWQYYTLSFR